MPRFTLVNTSKYLKDIILDLNKKDAVSIEKAQDFMNDCDLIYKVFHIYSNFGFLGVSIYNSRTFSLSLHRSTQIVQENKIQ